MVFLYKMQICVILMDMFNVKNTQIYACTRWKTSHYENTCQMYIKIPNGSLTVHVKSI
jgi:hypothetical protein